MRTLSHGVVTLFIEPELNDIASGNPDFTTGHYGRKTM